MENNESEEGFMTSNEFAMALGVTPTAVLKLMARYEMDVYQLKGSRLKRIRICDIGRHILQREMKPPTDKEGAELYWKCLRSLVHEKRSFHEIDLVSINKMNLHYNGKFKDITRLFFEIGINIDLTTNNGVPIGFKAINRV